MVNDCIRFMQNDVKKIYADGNIKPNNLPGSPIDQFPPAGAGAGGTPTYLGGEWFEGKTLSKMV
jgi:hypothetical protein